MIRTIRDAEAQITALQRQIQALENKINNIPAQNAPSSSNQGIDKQQVLNLITQTSSNVDSELTLDGGTVIHKLKHLFTEIIMQLLEVDEMTANTIFTATATLENLDIKSSAALLSAFHLSGDNDDKQIYFVTSPTGAQLAHGAMHNGTNWIAKETKAIIIQFHTASGWTFLYNSGLTIGNSFTPTARARINLSGDIDILGNITMTGTVNCVNVNASSNVIATAGMSANTIAIASLIQAAGHNGFTGSDVVLTSLTKTTATLNYKDWAGTNQSMTVVTNVVGNLHPGLNFYLGIRA